MTDQQSTAPPNVLLIIADDLNSWIGALNSHPQVKTPNIDALSRRGLLFTNAYCSAPYCNASRMGLFTGLLPASLGVYHNEPFWPMADRPRTFIEDLKDQGYQTFGAGKVFHGVYDYAEAGRTASDRAKWREAENRPELWDRFYSNNDEPLPRERPLNGLFDFSKFDEVPGWYHHFDWGPSPEEVECDLPDVQSTSHAEAFLAVKHDRPFFAAVGLYKPHLPWHAPQRFFDLYPRNEVIVPVVKDDDLDDVPPIGRKWALSPNDHKLIRDRDVWRDAVQGYLACISYCDWLIGRIISALDDGPNAKDTAIVLCGDNGFHLGEKLHWRKFALWEEATRVPLIVMPPGGILGQRIVEPVSLVDIHPTILEFAGSEFQRTRDSESLLSYHLGGKTVCRSRGAISTWLKDNHSLRTKRWRLTQYSDGTFELYDHATDPHEWTNLADYPEFLEIRESLSRQLGETCGG